jgi:hypothetical protein
LLLLLPEVFDPVLPVEALPEVLPEASPLVEPLVLGEAEEPEASPLVLPLVLGEAEEPEVSPLVLVLLLEPMLPVELPDVPLCEPMLPVELPEALPLGVWLVEPDTPPVVELLPEVLGVWAGFEVSVLEVEEPEVDGVCDVLVPLVLGELMLPVELPEVEEF